MSHITTKVRESFKSNVKTAVIFISFALAAPLALATATTHSIDIWWPVSGVSVEGTQPFKAMVPGVAVEQYEMFWYVDHGVWNWMDNNYQDYPHKEAAVNLSGWTWRGSGPYKVTFVARQNGKIIAERTIDLMVGGSAPATVAEAASALASQPISQLASAQEETPAPNSVVEKTTSVSSSIGVSGEFYVNPNNPAARQASEWRASRPEDAAKMDTLAAQPQAVWLGGWNADVEKDVRAAMAGANAENKLAVFVAYNIPYRDCGGYSAGGVAESQYTSWIRSIGNGIGSGKAIVILEPDALAGISCLSAEAQASRLALISQAVDILKQNPNTKVYLDAGHSGWHQGEVIAGVLVKAGVAKADGFFLNVSNFRTTSDEIAYGEKISAQTGGKRFVIDTSRNGNGPNGDEWCNPPGRAIGRTPTTNTSSSLIDAYLWVKTPGESDGSCNGAPAAGVWWPEYALGLVNSAR